MAIQELIPISYIQQLGFCEYSVFLRYVREVETEPTEQMKIGKKVHKRLFDEFLVTSKPSTIKQMIKKSRKLNVLSRELYVKSKKFGIHGAIDEIQFSPNNFLIIDDKPGTRIFQSNINQVFAYCLTFYDCISSLKIKDEVRPIIAALRDRDTQKIIWKSSFNEDAQKSIAKEINRMHSMIEGKVPFLPTNNQNKCHNCSIREVCDRYS